MRGLFLTIAVIVMATSGPAVAADGQPICADRRSKSTGPCTVPKGQWQIETGLIDWSQDKSNGVSTDMTAWGNTAIKYGIGSKADIELWLTPLQRLAVRGGGAHD